MFEFLGLVAMSGTARHHHLELTQNVRNIREPMLATTKSLIKKGSLKRLIGLTVYAANMQRTPMQWGMP